MAIWWVNHNQTYKQERGGGYIWSPKTKANGARSHFYDNMKEVQTGDTVVSFANALISDIGVARSTAYDAALPTSYLKIGENWNRGDGWIVPINWQSLSVTVRPQDIIDKLGPLLPDKYSPLQRGTGYGNQAAYVAEVSEEVFDLIMSHTATEDLSGLGKLRSETLGEEARQAAEDVIENTIARDPNLDATEKMALCTSRRGQGQFKENLRKVESKCRLTGVSDPKFLVASHILAWSKCTTSHERLDGNNGLLLTPNADKLFDNYLITFSDNGDVIVSKQISDRVLNGLGLKKLRERNVGPFNVLQRTYLEAHRKRYVDLEDNVSAYKG